MQFKSQRTRRTQRKSAHPADLEDTAAAVAASRILRLTPPARDVQRRAHAERQRDVPPRHVAGAQTVRHRHSQVADDAQHDFFQGVALVFCLVFCMQSSISPKTMPADVGQFSRQLQLHQHAIDLDKAWRRHLRQTGSCLQCGFRKACPATPPAWKGIRRKEFLRRNLRPATSRLNPSRRPIPTIRSARAPRNPRSTPSACAKSLATIGPWKVTSPAESAK